MGDDDRVPIMSWPLGILLAATLAMVVWVYRGAIYNAAMSPQVDEPLRQMGTAVGVPVEPNYTSDELMRERGISLPDFRRAE